MNAAVLTISDRCSRGEATDTGGPMLAELVRGIGADVVATQLVPDERADIERVLVEWSDGLDVDVIVTTGGTGLSPRDVTPEATRAVIDREAPGIAEAMRMRGMESTPFAMLSRQVVGQRGTSLIVNFPGSPAAISEGFDAVRDVLRHAVGQSRGTAPA